jgi:hypothetical protein
MEDDGHDRGLAPVDIGAAEAELDRHRMGLGPRAPRVASWPARSPERRIQESIIVSAAPQQGASVASAGGASHGGHLFDEGATELQEGRDGLAHRRAKGPAIRP